VKYTIKTVMLFFAVASVVAFAAYYERLNPQSQWQPIVIEETLTALSDSQGLLDNDHDGVPNRNDNCIGVYNPDQSDSQGNGVGDGCRFNVPGDIDGDRLVSCTDVRLMRELLGLRREGPGWNPLVDQNSDGVIDSVDVEMVAKQLPRGMKCD
jgi:hypothetical protein